MKTIHVGNRVTRNRWSVLLMAALGGLYFYQRRGGKIGDLATRGFSGIRSLRSKIEQVAPSVASYIPQSGAKGVGAMNRSTQTSAYQPSTTV